MAYRILTLFLFILLCTLFLLKQKNQVKWRYYFSALLTLIPAWVLFWYMLSHIGPQAAGFLWNNLHSLFTVGIAFYLVGMSFHRISHELIYVSALVFLLHEFSLNFNIIVNKYTIAKENIAPPDQITPQFLIVYGVILLLVIQINPRKKDSSVSVSDTLFRICILVLSTMNIFSIICLSRKIHPHEINDVLFIILVMLEFSAFVYIISRSSAEQELSLQLELDINKRLQEAREQQYQIAVQNQADLNKKCHDMKHYIAYLRQEQVTEKSDRIINDLAQTVEEFDNRIRTGNPVLDTILTQEHALCRQNQIEFRCVADGALLEYIDHLDLYVLFGNIMDNSIEYVRNYQEPEKRLISLSVFCRHNMIGIKEENFCDKEPELRDGLPITSKSDAGNHGFGLRSVRSIAEKYGGYMTVQYENGLFTISVLLPREMPNA